MEMLLCIAQELTRRTAVPCTRCRYCVEKCPKKLDIPSFSHSTTEKSQKRISAASSPASLLKKQPMSCVACHSCEKVCPQGIKIATVMDRFTHLLHG